MDCVKDVVTVNQLSISDKPATSTSGLAQPNIQNIESSTRPKMTFNPNAPVFHFQPKAIATQTAPQQFEGNANDTADDLYLSSSRVISKPHEVKRGKDVRRGSKSRRRDLDRPNYKYHHPDVAAHDHDHNRKGHYGKNENGFGGEDYNREGSDYDRSYGRGGHRRRDRDHRDRKLYNPYKPDQESRVDKEHNKYDRNYDKRLPNHQKSKVHPEASDLGRVLFDPRCHDPLKFSRQQATEIEDVPTSSRTDADTTKFPYSKKPASGKLDRTSEGISRLHHDLVDFEEQVSNECARMQQWLNDLSDRLDATGDTAARWRAIVQSHRTLTDNYVSYISQIVDPERSEAMKRLARRQRLPQRLWNNAVFSLLELTHRASYLTPETVEFTIDHTYFAYATVTSLLAFVPDYALAWCEELGDIMRFRFAIERERAAKNVGLWNILARRWYQKAISLSPSKGRIYQRLGILSNDDPLGQLMYFCKALITFTPYNFANESMLLQTFDLESRSMDSLVDKAFIRLHHSIFLGNGNAYELSSGIASFLNTLNGKISSQQWRRFAIINVAAVQDYNVKDFFNGGGAELAYRMLQRIITSNDLATNNAALGYILIILAHIVESSRSKKMDELKFIPWAELASWLSCYLPSTVEWERKVEQSSMSMSVDADDDEEEIIYSVGADDKVSDVLSDGGKVSECNATWDKASRQFNVLTTSTFLPEDWYLAGLPWATDLSCSQKEHVDMDGATIVNPQIEESEPTGARLPSNDANMKTESVHASTIDVDDFVADMDKMAIETQSTSTPPDRGGSNAETEEKVGGFEHNVRPFIVKVPARQLIKTKLKWEREHVGNGETEIADLKLKVGIIHQTRWQRIADYALLIARYVDCFEFDSSSRSFIVRDAMEVGMKGVKPNQGDVVSFMDVDESSERTEIQLAIKQARTLRTVSTARLSSKQVIDQVESVDNVPDNATIFVDSDFIITHIELFQRIVNHVGKTESMYWSVIIPRVVVMELMAFAKSSNALLAAVATEAIEIITSSIGALTTSTETKVFVQSTRGKSFYHLMLVRDEFDFEYGTGKSGNLDLRSLDGIFVATVERVRNAKDTSKNKSRDIRRQPIVIVCGNERLRKRCGGISIDILQKRLEAG